jgi:carboxypeptidase Taq
MESKLAYLKTILAEISDLQNAAGLLGWDQQTYMPPGGAEDRGYQLGTLRKLAHTKFTSEEVGGLLDELDSFAEQLPPDSNDARLIRVTRREYKKQTKVPPDMVREFAQVTTQAFQVWQEARAEDNFPKFRPFLERIVILRRQYADLFAPYDHIYDPLLDDFEPGLKTAEVKAIFNALRPQQVDLIKAISEHSQVDFSFLYQPFDEQKQWNFGVEVITKFGYDWKRGHLDKSAHPFTQSFSIDDVRITTRLSTHYIGSALFGTMHESGHAIYEQGVDHALSRSPLASGASLAFHESQSRMWENLVGRSMPFWEHFYPRMQAIFPSQLGEIKLEKFYKGINKVEPSLIRVEADEATYNLHIMLRLEIEIALMEKKLEVKDLPEAWNTYMKDYLGIIPPNDTKGVLQDVHWSSGMIGYFSTYALGNLISAQLWERINADIPDLPNQIREGRFMALLDWLRVNIHRHGAKFESQELVQRITGSKIDPAAYVRYLRQKYDEIYQL